jgi:hypothetical protein
MTHATTNPPENLLTRAARLSRENPQWDEIYPPILLESTKHKLVGELLRELHTCDISVVLTEEQKQQEYWTGQAMMRPGLQITKLLAHLIRRQKEFST